MAIEPTPKKNVGIRPETNLRLEKICAIRGWTKAEALERLAQHEIAILKRERKWNDHGTSSS